MKVMKLELYVEPVKPVTKTVPSPTCSHNYKSPVGTECTLCFEYLMKQPIYQMPSYADNYAFYNYPNTLNQFDPHSDIEWHMMTNDEIHRLNQLIQSMNYERDLQYRTQIPNPWQVEQERMEYLKQQYMLEQMYPPPEFTASQVEQLQRLVMHSNEAPQA